MDKAEQVKVQIELPTTILKPGQLIQLQKEIEGRGDQVQIELEQITNTSFEWNGEDENFNRLVFYKTMTGITIGHDLQAGNWWLVIKRPGQPNYTSPICVFPI